MSVQKSFLSPLGFNLVFNKLPSVVLNVTSVTLPGIQMEDMELQTPFKALKFADRVVYNDLVVRFKVDEDMTNYREVFDWMVSIGRPEQFSSPNPNKFIPNDQYGHFVSDATLSILNSVNRANLEVRFKDVFPVAISDIEFTAQDSDVTYVDATVNFRCLSFTIHTV